LPEQHKALTDDSAREKLSSQLKRVCHREQRHLHRIEAYRKGSAFLVNLQSVE
jgi:hypothetical protein